MKDVLSPPRLAEAILATLRTGTNKKLKSVARELARELDSTAPGAALDTRWVVSALDRAGRAARQAHWPTTTGCC